MGFVGRVIGFMEDIFKDNTGVPGPAGVEMRPAQEGSRAVVDSEGNTPPPEVQEIESLVRTNRAVWNQFLDVLRERRFTIEIPHGECISFSLVILLCMDF
jgi:hypothetical protein